MKTREQIHNEVALKVALWKATTEANIFDGRSTKTLKIERTNAKIESFKTLARKEKLPLRITSTIRPGAKTANGKVSNHSRGEAIDILPVINGKVDKSDKGFEYLRNAMYSNPNVRAWLEENGWGILEEITPGTMKKTRATGKHFHVGADNIARLLYNKIVLQYVTPEVLPIINQDLSTYYPISRTTQLPLEVVVPLVHTIEFNTPTIEDKEEAIPAVYTQQFQDNAIVTPVVIPEKLEPVLVQKYITPEQYLTSILNKYFVEPFGNYSALGGIINTDNPIPNFADNPHLEVPAVRYSEGGNLFLDNINKFLDGSLMSINRLGPSIEDLQFNDNQQVYFEQLFPSYIGGNREETRHLYMDLDTLLLNYINKVAKIYDINPAVLAYRIANEGIIDDLINYVNDFHLGKLGPKDKVGRIPTGNEFLSLEAPGVGFQKWGLDDVGSFIEEGKILLRNGEKFFTGDAVQENGRLVVAADGNRMHDNIGLQAATLKYLRDVALLDNPNLTEEEANKAALIYFNRGIGNGRKYMLNMKGKTLGYDYTTYDRDWDNIPHGFYSAPEVTIKPQSPLLNMLDNTSNFFNLKSQGGNLFSGTDKDLPTQSMVIGQGASGKNYPGLFNELGLFVDTDGNTHSFTPIDDTRGLVTIGVSPLTRLYIYTLISNEYPNMSEELKQLELEKRLNPMRYATNYDLWRQNLSWNNPFVLNMREGSDAGMGILAAASAPIWLPMAGSAAATYLAPGTTGGTIAADLAMGALGANVVDLAMLNDTGKTWQDYVSDKVSLIPGAENVTPFWRDLGYEAAGFTNPGWATGALTKPVAQVAEGAYDLTKQGLNWANRNYVLPYNLYREIGNTSPVLEDLNPTTRIKLGDVEINNPLLAYRQGPSVADDFLRRGNVTNPEINEEQLLNQYRAEYELLPESKKVKTGIFGYSNAEEYAQNKLDDIRYFPNAMFSQGRLWFKPGKGQLLTTAEPLGVANKGSYLLKNYPENGTFDLRAINEDGTPMFLAGRRVLLIEGELLNPHNTSAYTWEPNYGYRKVTTEPSASTIDFNTARTAQELPNILSDDAYIKAVLEGDMATGNYLFEDDELIQALKNQFPNGVPTTEGKVMTAEEVVELMPDLAKHLAAKDLFPDRFTNKASLIKPYSNIEAALRLRDAETLPYGTPNWLGDAVTLTKERLQEGGFDRLEKAYKELDTATAKAFEKEAIDWYIKLHSDLPEFITRQMAGKYAIKEYEEFLITLKNIIKNTSGISLKTKQKDPTKHFDISKNDRLLDETIFDPETRLQILSRQVDFTKNADEFGYKAKAVGVARGEKPYIFKDRPTEYQNSLATSDLAVHEFGHTFDFLSSRMQDLLGVNMKGLSNYFHRRGGTELVLRFSQLKNYFGLSESEPLTAAHIKFARKYYVRDRGYDNSMQIFLDAITEPEKAASWGLKWAPIIIPGLSTAAIGLSAASTNSNQQALGGNLFLNN